MITLYDVMQLDCTQTFIYKAGNKRLTQPIMNVAIMDDEPMNHNYDVFLQHEFVLTSMLFAKNDIRLGNEALKALIQRKVSAVAIKSSSYYKLDDEIIQMANQSDTVFFIYKDIYMEEIISEIKNLLKSDQDESRYEELIYQLIKHKPDKLQKRKIIHELLPKANQNIQVFMMDFKCPVYMLNKRIKQVRNLVSDLKGNVYYYQQQAVVIVPCDKPFKDFPLYSKLPADICYIGISGVLSYESLDMAILQGEHALWEAKRLKQSKICYEALNEQLFYYAVKDNELIQCYCEKQLEKLKKADKENGSLLEETLYQYIHAHGDVKTCAEAMFQHPNTIRYRLSKVKTVLEKENMTDRQFDEYLFLLIFLHKGL